MLKQCLEVFDSYPSDVSAYTEIIIDTAAFAVEAVVGGGGYGDSVHDALLNHWDLTEAQLPHLEWGPGLKGPGPLLQERSW